MVRLKYDLQDYHMIVAQFQFHYGSIKIAPDTSVIEEPATVSIPLWFD